MATLEAMYQLAYLHGLNINKVVYFSEYILTQSNSWVRLFVDFDFHL